jgi:hypothetical protein
MDLLFETVKSPWFSLFSLLVGIAITVLFFKLAKRDREPCYAISGLNIINRWLPKLAIHYRGYGEDLERLSLTFMAFWNRGRGTIENASAVKEDPIRINIEDGQKIIDAVIIQASREVCKCTCVVSHERSYSTLGFSFLDHNDGAVICLYLFSVLSPSRA